MDKDKGTPKKVDKGANLRKGTNDLLLGTPSFKLTSCDELKARDPSIEGQKEGIPFPAMGQSIKTVLSVVRHSSVVPR